MRIVEYDNHHVCSFGTASPVEFPVVGSAVTIGSFDGVHKGHRMIIARLVALARSRQLRSVVVTFEPHPRRVLKGAVTGPLGLLTTLEEKINLLSREGVDLLFVVRFTPDFARRSSEDFIRNVLVNLIGAKSIIIGYDHAFGRDRSGSGTTLEHLGGELDFDVEVLDELLIGDEHFSSTRIRQLLASGLIAEANEFLGSPYMISGVVVDGDKRGREIGFPTVNLQLSDPDKLLPRSGVYLARTELDGRSFKVMMNIGLRPTVSSEGITTVEAYILGYSGTLYGRTLKFSLFRFIREERKFTSLDELKNQLEKDKKTVELYSI
ncbi:bifunctional riboflavin kinase/FAD synthetase [Chlorobium ferrooxidans]|uniref:Riboflavin biosynthesis protein n=1 Tax=Chlorobium ferrooxidans DSM 13031 TaxID=377431 RepID=Q0YSJ9_9CHLB|nr:bifunctional riboflavin kinase/FAD synthetase [Chlorobium ferrooxidans]EAT59200.1 riboflavin biosynthesis protein RibF [Chlorobium ferrooxidans DSM 13031]